MSARRTSRKIDFSDIPDSSPEQLKAMRRVGRPPIWDAPRQLVAIRLDVGVLDRFRKEAKRRGVGYRLEPSPYCYRQLARIRMPPWRPG